MSTEACAILVAWARGAVRELSECMRHPNLGRSNRASWQRALETISQIEMAVQEGGVDIDSLQEMIGFETTTLRAEFASVRAALLAILRLLDAIEELQVAAAEFDAVAKTTVAFRLDHAVELS
jgi:hypothetical protein